MTDYTHQLQTAVELARQAGHLILKLYDTDFSVTYKGKSDPVTEADQRANDLIVEGLNRQFPNDLIVAEESVPPKEPLPTDFVWYVDPGSSEVQLRFRPASFRLGLRITLISLLATAIIAIGLRRRT